MERTITVNGMGFASVKPDMIGVVIKLISKDEVYSKAMSNAAAQIEELREAIVKIGFNKESLQTLDFDVDTSTKWIKDEEDECTEEVIVGYECTHRLNLEFDLDIKLLGKVLDAISTCSSSPALTISFLVKDPNTIRAEILKQATLDAKRRAEILCKSANVKLGKLMSINYEWEDHETDPYARSRKIKLTLGTNIKQLDVVPTYITLKDTATFEWEII